MLKWGTNHKAQCLRCHIPPEAVGWVGRHNHSKESNLVSSYRVLGIALSPSDALTPVRFPQPHEASPITISTTHRKMASCLPKVTQLI